MSRLLYSLHIVCWTPLEEACWAANESQPCGSSAPRTPAGNRIAPPLFGEGTMGHGDRPVVWEQLVGQGSSKVQRTGKINVGRHHEGRNRFLVGLKKNVFAFCKATGHWKSENWETGNCFYKYTCISILSQLFRSIFLFLDCKTCCWRLHLDKAWPLEVKNFLVSLGSWRQGKGIQQTPRQPLTNSWSTNRF